jgi:hypothetical protein
MHPKTTTPQAQDGVTKIVGILAETTPDTGHPAVHTKGLAAEVTAIGPDTSAENDQVRRAMIAADTDTAATDTAIPAVKMRDGHLGGIVMCDHALALRGNHAALQHEH